MVKDASAASAPMAKDTSAAKSPPMTSPAIIKMAEAALAKRNAGYVEFDLTGIDVDYIISCDTLGLLEGLRDKKFSCVDIIKAFGERAQRIGRALRISAEENFKEALELAAEKDKMLGRVADASAQER